MHKKLYSLSLSIILLILLAHRSSAQISSKSIEVAANYGKTSATQIFLTLPRGKAIYIFKRAATPCYYADVKYYLSRNFAVGLTAGMQHLSYDYNNSGSISVPSYTLTGNVINVTCELKGLYLNLPWFQFYGLFGAGVRFFPISSAVPEPERPPSVWFNTQWTPVGLRVGNALGGFAEFGIGYKGLVNMGISYCIPTRQKMHKP